MRAEQIICDICGRVKGKTNHWFTLSTASSSGPEGLAEDRTELLTQHFDAAAKEAELEELGIVTEKHACGNACVQKLVERWVGTGSLEPSRIPAGDPAA